MPTQVTYSKMDLSMPICYPFWIRPSKYLTMAHLSSPLCHVSRRSGSRSRFQWSEVLQRYHCDQAMLAACRWLLHQSMWHLAAQTTMRDYFWVDRPMVGRLSMGILLKMVMSASPHRYSSEHQTIPLGSVWAYRHPFFDFVFLFFSFRFVDDDFCRLIVMMTQGKQNNITNDGHK